MILRLSLAGVLCWMSCFAWAYEVQTHSEISDNAVSASNIAVKLAALGLTSRVSSVDDTRFHSGRSIAEVIMDGSKTEDDIISSETFARFSNHFYDPLHTSAADNYGGLNYGLLDGKPSPAWGLEDDPNVPISESEQIYSYKDGQEYFYRALTSPRESDRRENFMLMFRTLGQVIHLIQDVAQPQHTRNDSHGGFLGTGQASLYEVFTDRARSTLPFGGGTASFPGARDFWHNDQGTGLAQFSNRNFVTTGTNFRIEQGAPSTNQRYPLPRLVDPNTGATISVQEAYAELGQSLPQSLANFCVERTDCVLTFFSTTEDVHVSKATTLSIFDQDIEERTITYMANIPVQTYQVDRIFSLNRLNFLEAHRHLIPRATAYSAGLINHFFRGQMEITPPDEGVYGIVDHSTGQGFRTIKLKLKNTTPENEAMSGGTLVAVVKFHRNGCYRPDLSGEFTRDAAGNLITPCNDYRTKLEEAAVSDEVNAAVDSADPHPFTFTFADPIPVNATDLYLQVVYRGALGSESDAVVVATKDLFEPSYLTFFNSTDYLHYNGTFLPTTDPLLLPTLDRDHDGLLDTRYDQDNMNVYFGFTGSFDGAPLGTINALPPGRFSHVVLLTDRDPYPSPIEAATDRGDFYFATIFDFRAETNQLDYSTGVYRGAEFHPVRGIPSYAGLLLYRSYPNLSGSDLTQLPALTDPTPYPVTELHFDQGE